MPIEQQRQKAVLDRRSMLKLALAGASALLVDRSKNGGLSAQEVGKTTELSPGLVQKSLGELPSNVPGYDKVRIVEVTAQPGVIWKETRGPMEAAMFCTILSGERTSVRPDGRKSIRKAGDSYVCNLGQPRNPEVEHKITSKEPWVMRMHWLLKAGDK